MKLVITHHRPVRKALITLALIILVAFIVALALDYGHWKSIAHAMVSTGEKRSLLTETLALRRENEALHADLAQLRRGEQIARQARHDNHRELVRMQTEIADLNKEVEFYRDIFGATDVDVGPRVKGVRLRRLAGEGRYSYKLVMTHVNKEDRMAEGRLSLEVRGESGGRPKAIAFVKLIESGPDSFAFKFKHFHLFEGTLKMPAGFVPRQIQVAVTEKSRRKHTHKQTYDWASTLD